MIYATYLDMEARYPARDLIQLTNEVTPLALTFVGTPGTISISFTPLSLVFVQSIPSPLPDPQSTYIEGIDYSVDRNAGVITRIAAGAIPAGSQVFASA